MANPGSGKSVSKITSPKGTRDLYPEEALKRRYLEQCWRDASVRCGFEEIHGPTFETTDLYAVKSGEGILGELFQAYSGKAPEEVAQVQATGRAPYAMRPEFTPTLARMFAAKAGSLPKPCKWFTGGPYFRAERPQRGRLREFLQWNVDFIGDDGSPQARAQAEGECISCCGLLLNQIGFSTDDVAFRINHREMFQEFLIKSGVPEASIGRAYQIIDRLGKVPQVQLCNELIESGVPEGVAQVLSVGGGLQHPIAPGDIDHFTATSNQAATMSLSMLRELGQSLALEACPISCGIDTRILRGLAYYTGTVFEVLADGERAIAGGGRYDKLIELMGGPPTPAVGFAMGDVVVSLLLEDKGLMPQGAELMEAVSRRPASVRPEVFVVGADDESSDALVRRLSADLRRGVESDAYAQAGERKPWSGARYDAASGGVRPMHARVSYKSTRNLKKLLGDGEKQFARLAAIVHGPDRVQLKDFDARTDLTPRDVGLSDAHAEFSVDPASPVYVGRAVERVLG